eukprot:2573165-Rhodomonas_salina.1
MRLGGTYTPKSNTGNRMPGTICTEIVVVSYRHAMSGTHIGCAGIRWDWVASAGFTVSCPIGLRACYAMSGTDAVVLCHVRY